VLVPSEELPNGRSAVRAALGDGAAIRAAVAFVTRTGVAELAELLSGFQDVTVEITARAQDVTEPEALLALRELGADVSIVIGRHASAFHPKLWLVGHAEETIVIAGSGNLTGGGLLTNDEQFEVIRLPTGDPLIAAHHDRLDHLTRHALALDVIEGSAIWREWLEVRKRQQRIRAQLISAERNLSQRDPVPDRAAHKAHLIDDLQQIYDDTVAADLPRADGARYYPTRLLVAINAARDGEREPVKVVSDTIRRHTDGLDILLQAGRVDLTLEWLVADDTKPYHDLFNARSQQLARERVDAFRRAGHTLPAAGSLARLAADAVSHEEIREHLARLLDGRPAGYALPPLHRAEATLVALEPEHAVVRRGSGTDARIPVRLIRLRLNALASGQELLVSELAESNNDRFNSALGPLLTALPGVTWDSESQRLRSG
jgi:hypothetical protein